jgi:acyl carrier protein
MEIEAQIQRYVAQNLLFSDNGFEHSNDASFLEEGIVDSLGVLGLVAFVETSFGVAVDGQEITPDNFDSVNRLAGYIRRKLAGSG